MDPTLRRYQEEDDYWHIRAFLREVFLLNGRCERSWQVARMDYWRWHGIVNMGHGRLEEDVFIWETGDGHIAAVLNREGPGDAFLQVHPALRTPELEEEMIAVAGEHLAHASPGARRKLCIWAHADDGLRQDILTRRGYVRREWPEFQRQRPLDLPIAEASPPPGYAVRALGDVEELPLRSWLSWRAFHPNEPDEKYEGWEWYPNVQRAPLYRRDLDIVTVAPDGSLASFCTLWFDDVSRTGYFEPVGTAPEHQRRGLGKAVMCEALRRVKRMGATLATVAGSSPAANALYGSVMSTEYLLFEPWEKTF
jgi:mycothiol synthase